MTKLQLASCIGFFRGRQVARLSGLPLVVGILGFGMLTSASAQTDVRSFGARCNGSDDSGAINAALSSLPNGSTLTLGCNLGVGSSYLKLQNKQGVTIDGAGGSLTSLAGNSDHVLLLIEGCNGCKIRNLTINGNSAGVEGIYVRWSSNTSLENNTIYNITLPGAAGIIAMGNNGNRYVSNTIYNTSGPAGDGPRGLWIGNAATDLLDRNATITNNNIHDIAATGLVLQTVGATATGNLIERTQGACIKVEPTVGQGGTITLDSNTARGCAWHGVQINHADMPVYLRNNTITNNSVSGVYSTYYGFPGGQITGNTISGNNITNLYLYDANGVTIANNQIANGGNGIVFEADPGAVLQNVQVNSNTITGSREDGIVVRGRGGYFSGLSVSSNSIYSNGRYGMSMEESNAGAITNVSLNGNCFANNGAGSLLDIRLTSRLSVSTSGSCGPAGSGATSTTTSAGSTSTGTSSGSTSGTTSGSTSDTSTGMTPIRVNAGGGQFTDSAGNVWSGDVGYSGGNAYSNGNGIAGTSTAAVYQSHRWNPGTLSYNFQVPSGARTVTLKFAEIYWNAPGRRVFSVSINGQQVLSNFDIYAAAGANTAIDKTFQVQSNGQITIQMTTQTDAAMVSGIEIK